MGKKLQAISRRLNGFAYQKNIVSFMTCQEIEKSATEIKGEVAGLRKLGWGLTSAVFHGAVGLLV